MSVIIFDSPASPSDKDGHPPRSGKFVLGSANKKLMNRILLHNGLVPTTGDDFSLVWASSPETDNITVKSPYQKINHFPFSKKILGNKAELADIIQSHPKYRTMTRFFPLTFVLPDDRDELFELMKSRPTTPFIAKPPAGSCGHGIKLVQFNEFYSIPRGSVVQEYISRPLCIDGFKFDLRIYVLVTSFAPLRAFVYKNGLARFATESYSNYSKDMYSHLTNATLNKHSSNWSNEFKWTLYDILAEIKVRFNKSEEEMMNKIIETVQKTLVLVQPSMVPKTKKTVMDPYFELYGFDLLVDCNFDCWLLEINTNPSMACDSEVDCAVKTPLLAQTLSIVGISDLAGDDLKTYQFEFDPAKDDLEEVENDFVEMEDERNESSGSGFVRIFPSEKAESLMKMCVRPKFPVKPPDVKKETKIDPMKLAPMLSSNQATQLLLKYLSNMEAKLRNGELSVKSTSRLQKFLIAQGFETRKVSTNLKAILHNYIIRQRTQLAMARTEASIPVGIQKQLENIPVQTLSQLLAHCTMYNVRDVQSLFV